MGSPTSPEPAPTTNRSRSLRRYLPVSLESLDFCMVELDLYIWRDQDTEPALYRGAGVEFTEGDARRLLEQGVKHLYIPVERHAAYRRMVVDRMELRIREPRKRLAERWKAVRLSCEKMVQDVLTFPGQAEAVGMVGEIGAAFARWSQDPTTGFSYMLDMSAHDYYTTSHMVNVGVGCGLLVRELRPGDQRLLAVAVQGGMLHDIGKRRIAPATLNKEGKLTPAEWTEMQRHPMTGYEELKTHADMPTEVLEMARDHHERLDGKGFPQGLRGDQISFAARVCAVVDAYDSITAARPNRGPIAPHDALKLLRDGRGTHFDPDVLDAWAGFVHRQLKEDPERAPTRSARGVPTELADLTARPNPVARIGAERPKAAEGSGGNRRRHARLGFRAQATGIFVHQGKPLPVPCGEEFQLGTLDLSRGGLSIETPWPVTIGDVLSVALPQKNGPVLRKLVQVVRTRRLEGDVWVSGCCFVRDGAVTGDQAA